jgi:hypothetical protein
MPVGKETLHCKRKALLNGSKNQQQENYSNIAKSHASFS